MSKQLTLEQPVQTEGASAAIRREQHVSRTEPRPRKFGSIAAAGVVHGRGILSKDSQGFLEDARQDPGE